MTLRDADVYDENGVMTERGKELVKKQWEETGKKLEGQPRHGANDGAFIRGMNTIWDIGGYIVAGIVLLLSTWVIWWIVKDTFF